METCNRYITYTYNIDRIKRDIKEGTTAIKVKPEFVGK